MRRCSEGPRGRKSRGQGSCRICRLLMNRLAITTKLCFRNFILEFGKEVSWTLLDLHFRPTVCLVRDSDRPLIFLLRARLDGVGRVPTAQPPLRSPPPIIFDILNPPSPP